MEPKIIGKYSLFAFFFTAAAAVSLFLQLPAAVRVPLAAAYLIGVGALIGTRLFPAETPFWRTFLGALAACAMIMIAGGIIYYLYRLDAAAVALVLVVPTAVFSVPIPKRRDLRSFFVAGAAPEEERGDAHGRIPPARLVAIIALSVAVTVLLAFAFSILQTASTDLAIRSPWDVVPRMFLVVVFMAALAAFALAYGSPMAALSVAATTGLAFAAVAVAAYVYRVGFGFDPFIHQATESVIARLGEIRPKPLYYLGQYALVTVLAKLTGLPVFAIDRWLVPTAFAAVIPCAYFAARRAFAWPPAMAAAASFSILLLPLSSFIATTPQGLANALVLMTAFLAAPAATRREWPASALVLFAAAAAMVHPLAGIPAAFFVAILLFLRYHEKGRGAQEVGRILVLAELALIGAVALPAVFLLHAKLSTATVSLNIDLLRQPSAILSELKGEQLTIRRFMAGFDAAYLWRSIREAVIAIAAALGIAMLARRAGNALAYAIGFLVFLSNYVILKTVLDFGFLIDYERSNYADRMLELAIILVAPMAAYAFGRLLLRARHGIPAFRVGVAFVIAGLVTGSVYLAYPRRDLYESSRGWSTSAADVKAVRSINKDANGRDYAVLANQSVSAAAIREFGFKRYYGDIFFYPIPTGGRLYEKFLAMNAAYGAAEVAEETMALTGTDTVYFVVNNYWWQAQRIIVGGRREADEWWSVDDMVWVFKYKK